MLSKALKDITERNIKYSKLPIALQKDYTIAFAALQVDVETRVHRDLLHNRDFIKDLIRSNNFIYSRLPEYAFADRELVSMMIGINNRIWFNLSDELKDDEEFILGLIHRVRASRTFLSDRLRNSKVIITEIAKYNSHLFEHIGTELIEDRDFIIEMIEKYKIRLYMLGDYINDIEIVIKCLLNDISDIIYVPEKTKRDKRIRNIVLEDLYYWSYVVHSDDVWVVCGEAAKYANFDKQYIKDISHLFCIYPSISSQIQSNRYFVRELIKKYPLLNIINTFTMSGREFNVTYPNLKLYTAQPGEVSIVGKHRVQIDNAATITFKNHKTANVDLFKIIES